MSFMLTATQVLEQSKDVTRRLGWTNATVGQIVQPILKGQGLKKGETVQKLGCPIRFTAVDRVVLGDITPQDVHREGFPQMTTRDFIRMFKQHHGCRRDRVVTRIAFEYTVPSEAPRELSTEAATDALYAFMKSRGIA